MANNQTVGLIHDGESWASIQRIRVDCILVHEIKDGKFFNYPAYPENGYYDCQSNKFFSDGKLFDIDMNPTNITPRGWKFLFGSEYTEAARDDFFAAINEATGMMETICSWLKLATASQADKICNMNRSEEDEKVSERHDCLPPILFDWVDLSVSLDTEQRKLFNRLEFIPGKSATAKLVALKNKISVENEGERDMEEWVLADFFEHIRNGGVMEGFCKREGVKFSWDDAPPQALVLRPNTA